MWFVGKLVNGWNVGAALLFPGGQEGPEPVHIVFVAVNQPVTVAFLTTLSVHK